MARIMDRLKKDHRNVSRLVDLLESQLDAVREARSADFELMHDIMLYMTQYPDRTHHPMEDLVFARVRARDPGSVEVLDQLEREHRALAEKGGAFLEVLRHVVDGSMVEREELERRARDYVDFLRHHMRVEDERAFPVAERVLRREDWDQVSEAFAGREDPVFGPVAAEEFRSLLRFIERQST